MRNASLPLSPIDNENIHLLRLQKGYRICYT